MLISFNQVHSFILANASPINGILHIGAHLCEERYDYNANNNLNPSKYDFWNLDF